MAKKKASKKPAARNSKPTTAKRTTPAQKPAKKPAKKPAAKAAKKAPKRSAAPAITGPEQVTTGKGPGPAEIGADLVALFNAGKADEPCRKWWANEVVSIEGMGMAFHGKKAAEEKNKGWYEQHELLGGTAEGPYVGATGFAVKFNVHARERATGREIQMNEVGVYTVRDGKIICEEFMYGS